MFLIWHVWVHASVIAYLSRLDMYVCMYGWMDGRMDGWMDGWMDETQNYKFG